MTAAINNPLTPIFRTKNYLEEMEICDRSRQNHQHVRRWLDELLSSGHIAECGRYFDKPSNKVLKIYTNAIEGADALSAAIKTRQYRSQTRKLIAQIMTRYLSSCNIQPIQDELKLLPGRKVQPEFFLLQQSDFEKCYSAVIKHGPHYQTWKSKKENLAKKVHHFFEDKL